MKKLLGSASKLMTAKVISKNIKKVIASTVPRTASPRVESELIYKRKYGKFTSIHGCWSIWLFLCNGISQSHSSCKPIIKVRKRLLPTRLTCCDPLIENQCPMPLVYVLYLLLTKSQSAKANVFLILEIGNTFLILSYFEVN